MKIQKILLSIATVMLLATNPVWASKDDIVKKPVGVTKDDDDRVKKILGGIKDDRVKRILGGIKDDRVEKPEIPQQRLLDLKEVAKAPEIDAASGTSAIALLAGALLLAGERSRSRRS